MLTYSQMERVFIDKKIADLNRINHAIENIGLCTKTDNYEFDELISCGSAGICISLDHNRDKNCLYCGVKVFDNDRSCPNCGAPIKS
jgi:hypothetical protein